MTAGATLNRDIIKPLDPFSAINMACIACFDGGGARVQRHEMQRALAAIPGGQGWTLVGGWGPVSTDDLQAFIAVNFDQSLYAVAIGGRLNLLDPLVFKSWLLDLDIAQSDWVYPGGTGAKIGRKTLTQFRKLIQLSDSSTRLTLLQYLAGELSRNPGAVLMVTGHGQGGCQTTAVAGYLHDQLKPTPTINPYTFGAPTAGNSQFAQLCNAMSGQQFTNEWDIITKAFANLVGDCGATGSLTAMYPAGRPRFEDLFARETHYLEFVTLAAGAQIIYSQPDTGPAGSITSPGSISFLGPPLDGVPSFLQAAAQQHDRSLYFKHIARQMGYPGAFAPG